MGRGRARTRGGSHSVLRIIVHKRRHGRRIAAVAGHVLLEEVVELYQQVAGELLRRLVADVVREANHQAKHDDQNANRDGDFDKGEGFTRRAEMKRSGRSKPCSG